MPREDLQRLGETDEFGYALLGLLGRFGWDVVVTTPLAGGMIDTAGEGAGAPVGKLVIAERNGHEVRVVRETLGEAAGLVFHQATRVQGIAA